MNNDVSSSIRPNGALAHPLACSLFELTAASGARRRTSMLKQAR
jgi:hypothetical protein